MLKFVKIKPISTLFPPENVTGEVRFVGEPYRKKGFLYANITDFVFDFEPTGMTMKFDNLFNGNKALSKYPRHCWWKAFWTLLVLALVSVSAVATTMEPRQ